VGVGALLPIPELEEVMKFKFVMSAVVEAGSEEDALNKVANHIATVSRQTASDVNIAPEFGIDQVEDDAKASTSPTSTRRRTGPSSSSSTRSHPPA
jgi:hypothetical protein